ncbi:MAG: hypothetical protein H6581_17815 [Bacteroidia bacterium]|nr:hypothetical protein [Bacteroidia bacterium]
MAGFIGLIFVIAFAISKNTFKRLNEQVQKLADEMGLEAYLVEPKAFSFRPDYPTIRGKLGESDVTVYFYKTGSGKHQQFWTAADLTVYNPGRKTFKILKENFLTKIGKVFGGQDIQVGDPEFDKEFILKSNDEGFFTSLLSDPIRDQMMRVWVERKPAGNLELQGNRLKYVENGFMNSMIQTARMKQVLILMSALSVALSNGDYSTQQSDSASGQAQDNENYF